jgi:hypothetical protein
MQDLMKDAHWLFGGRYVGVASRRSFTAFDQYDIPLLGADGTLHVVELKGPKILQLIRRYRSHWIVGTDVHEAASQAMNYLRTLDEEGSGLETKYRNELGLEFDMRRVFATVVIGHHNHVVQPRDAPPVSGRVIEQTIRSYSAHLARVEVVTYNTLLDAASRALDFEHAELTTQSDGDGVATTILLPEDEDLPF